MAPDDGGGMPEGPLVLPKGPPGQNKGARNRCFKGWLVENGS